MKVLREKNGQFLPRRAEAKSCTFWHAVLRICVERLTSFPSSSHRHCCKLAVCNCGTAQNMTRKVFPHILASQQTTSWVPSEMVDLGYMYSVLHTALTSSFLSVSISNVTTSWAGCELCAAVLVSRPCVRSRYCPLRNSGG